MKAWYFLEDVNSEDGPFHYVPGSHRLTRRRIKWEYAESIRRSESGKTRHETAGGAFRPDENDVQELGLPDAIPLIVKKNTLVIADTLGFHKRGQAVAGKERIAIWVNSRVNPFNPFPGFHSKFFGAVRDGAYEWYFAKQLKKATRENKTARSALVRLWENPAPADKAAKSVMADSLAG
jgi:hypothetical protein